MNGASSGRRLKNYLNKLRRLVRANIGLAEDLGWRNLTQPQTCSLEFLTREFGLSIAAGELLLIDGSWYVTHTGLIRLSCRRRCLGIKVQPVGAFCDPTAGRYSFKATVYKSRKCKGFVGYGDADPSNVSPLVHGAEMRIAETRAVNRALRKAYGIGICSVEELASSAGSPAVRESKKVPPQPANGNYSVPKVRDRLCQIIRQNQLDPTLVKAYATDFCGTKTLREATREQVENFVTHLADWTEKDRNALLCQLNSYLGNKEGAARNAGSKGSMKQLALSPTIFRMDCSWSGWIEPSTTGMLRSRFTFCGFLSSNRRKWLDAPSPADSIAHPKHCGS